MKQKYQELQAIETSKQSEKIAKLEKMLDQIMRDMLKINASIAALKGEKK